MKETFKITVPNVHNFRKVYDSDGRGSMYGATCPIVSIYSVRDAIDKVLEINPRTQKQTSAPSRAMHETLRDAQDSFVFRNRGITFVVQDVSWDNKTEDLEMTFSIDPAADTQTSGLADGGHTYEVIKDFINITDESEQGEITAEVRLDIISGFDEKVDEIGAIVESRNTSTQVKDETLLNYRGVFKPIEDSLAKQKYANDIAYYENQLTDEKNPESAYRAINISSVLSYLMCFDQEVFNENQHPIAAYSSKKKALDWFEKRHKENEQDTIAFAQILPEILDLKDYIESQIPVVWNKVSGRFADQKGVKKLKNSKTLDFSQYQTDYAIPGGFIYPILGAFRSLLVKSDKAYKFRVDPKKIFDQMNAEKGRSLVYKLVNVQDKDPQTIGKNPELYDSCYGSLRGYYYESLNK